MFALHFCGLDHFPRPAVALAVAAALCMGAGDACADAKATVDFARDVRPILSNHCFQCHGPDEASREAGLRLDTEEGALEDLGGYRAVEPHHPQQSALIERITTSDVDQRMPPAESGMPLSPQQIEILRQWIAAGAPYDQHWAFRPIVRPPVPAAADASVGHPIDAFVQRRLQPAGLTLAPEADRPTLIRRVYLDLLGLPPTPAAVDAFVRDQRPWAYDAMLERALADPHYGERWGRHWLDQARYADTNGYTVDSPRSIWPYRDWVIQATNADMPFDQFTIQQLAGDLLPDATTSQLIATGFHRNTLVNQEGGSDREQFRNEAVIDRTNSTGAVWLGLTVGCAQCHTHKFDPLTQHEYYQLFAFFNSAEDANSTTPTVTLPTAAQSQRLADWDRQIAAAQKALSDYDAANAPGQPDADPDDGKRAADVQPQNEPQADAQRAALVAQLERLQKQRQAYAKEIPTTMVMRELPSPRETHVLIRGDFLRPGDRVQPDVPAVLPPMPASDAPRTRLDLARWLVDDNNPLVARVVANRSWMRLFGQGLVETENDFGLQGTPPSHPKLLDWLAAELIAQGWSMKHLHRTILRSATYRQSSDARADAAGIDPLNKLLARQTRLRVDAEVVRDLAVAVSGRMDGRIGGPSVHPPQPDGVYAFTQRGAAWPTSTGGDRYRRGMYTFFMRSAPYPMLTTFDTPRFNTTCTRRVRSNTPLQSLTMANSQPMLEAARGLAQRIMRNGGDDRQRIDQAYRVCFSRRPSANETQRLLQYVTDARQAFADAPGDATAFLNTDAGSGASGLDDAAVAIECAAWTSLSRVLLNLDEFITRE